jgi:hypothetical protein
MPCAPTYTPAVAALPAHGAALGMRFYAPPRIGDKTGQALGYDAAAFEAGKLPGMKNQVYAGRTKQLQKHE